MTVLLTGVGVVAVAISYGLARDEAAGFLDGQLRQIALNAGEGLPETAGPPVPHDPEDDFIIEVRGAAGERLRGSPLGAELPKSLNVGFSTVSLQGEDWRVYTSGDGRRTVQVGQRMSVRQERAEAAAIEAATPVLAVIPLAWLVLGWALGRVLDPLSVLARAIAARGVDSKEPISTLGVPEEVAPIVAAMNVLTERLQRALEQQRRFVSDAAHELRTPLAALRLQIETLRTAAEDVQPVSVTSALRGGIERASTLLEQLLRMARFDAPPEPAHLRRLDLAEIVTESLADHVAIASNKGVDLGMIVRQRAEVSGVAAELKIMFGNLIDNAVRYTPREGAVDVSVRSEDGRGVVEVADTGPGVPEEALPRLCDRFFRAAPPDIEGNGLGLAIVTAIARRHGASVSISNRRGRGGLLARVSFPGADSADATHP